MGKRIKIIADDKIPFLKGVLDQTADIEYLPAAEIKNESIKHADALLIRTRSKCDSLLLDNTSVKFIATATIGFDHIDVDYCKTNNIKWINAAGCNSSAVMQYFASAILTLSQKKNINLSDKTIGIIGVGNVGKKIEKLSRLLAMNVLLNDPPRERAEGSEKFTDLDDLIKASDIITFHVPLNLGGIDKTYHLADENFFGKLKNSKILINTSRGEVIKTEALIEWLRSGIISSCVLDVWENEPDINPELLELVDIATPHIAGYSVEGKTNGTAACVNALNEYFDLGLEQNWYPQNLPIPYTANEIVIECGGKSMHEIFHELIISTYSIQIDDQRLRTKPNEFEKQRENYPVRREFPYYNVKLIRADNLQRKKIEELDFKVI